MLFLVKIALMIHSAFAMPGEGPRFFVNSERELLDHLKLHAERVKRLGLALYDETPRWQVEIPRKDVESFLALHDAEKIKSSTYLSELYSLAYATDWKGTNSNARKELEETLIRLNDSDRKAALAFFERRDYLESNGSLKEAAKKLLLIERIADLVDRTTDPVAQRELTEGLPPPLEMFFADQTLLEVAYALRLQYFSIVKGLEWSRN